MSLLMISLMSSSDSFDISGFSVFAFSGIVCDGGGAWLCVFGKFEGVTAKARRIKKQLNKGAARVAKATLRKKLSRRLNERGGGSGQGGVGVGLLAQGVLVGRWRGGGGAGRDGYGLSFYTPIASRNISRIPGASPSTMMASFNNPSRFPKPLSSNSFL